MSYAAIADVSLPRSCCCMSSNSCNNGSDGVVVDDVKRTPVGVSTVVITSDAESLGNKLPLLLTLVEAR